MVEINVNLHTKYTPTPSFCKALLKLFPRPVVEQEAQLLLRQLALRD